MESSFESMMAQARNYIPSPCDTCPIVDVCENKNAEKQTMRAVSLLRRVVIFKNEVYNASGLTKEQADAAINCNALQDSRECGYQKENS